MNILFICDEYPPAKSGGIGSVTKIVAEGLANRGHNVVVFGGRLYGHNLPQKSISGGVTIYRHTYFLRLRNWIKNRYFVSFLKRFKLLGRVTNNEIKIRDKAIEEIINSHNIDLVEMPDYTLLTPYYNRETYIPFKKFSVKTVARVHGSISFLSYFRDGLINQTGKLNDSSFFGNVDAISAVSQFSADFLKNNLDVNKEVTVVYNPLDESFQENARTCCRVDDNESCSPYVFFLGKIIETKGAFTLIKAFNQFSISHPEYKLIMAGSGDISYAKSLIDPSIKDKVEFTGYISRKELIKFISESAFCVIPSYYENFSMAALEVMSMKKPLIYTKETSGPEVIDDGVDGILVNPREPKEIFNAMCFLSSNPTIIKEIGQNAYRKISTKFSTKIIIDQLEKFYSSTCNH